MQQAGTTQPPWVTVVHKGVADVSTEEMDLLLRNSETPLDIWRPSYEGLWVVGIFLEVLYKQLKIRTKDKFVMTYYKLCNIFLSK